MGVREVRIAEGGRHAEVAGEVIRSAHAQRAASLCYKRSDLVLQSIKISYLKMPAIGYSLFYLKSFFDQNRVCIEKKSFRNSFERYSTVHKTSV